MRDEIEDLINESLDEIDDLEVFGNGDVSSIINSKINDQNKKVSEDKKRQELIKKIDELKRINPDISYDESMNDEELERIISEINI